MATDLDLKYRPKTLGGLVGQPGARDVLGGFIREGSVPHKLLFVGPSGTGKTTAARIVKEHLQCKDGDFFEINAADHRGIDDVRRIRKRMGLRPLGGGKARVYLFDEAHNLTGDAQTALLKMVEEPPPHVWFFLATTEPESLKDTIRKRCTQVTFNLVKTADLLELVSRIAKKEKKEVEKKVLNRIVDMAEGSPRVAVKLLEATFVVDGEDGRLDALVKSDTVAGAFALVQALMPFKGRPVWATAASVLKDIEAENPEGIRQMIIKTARTHMLKGGSMAIKGYYVINVFRDRVFEPGLAGHAILGANCWEICNRK